MKNQPVEKKGEMVLFTNVPVGAEIRFNGCRVLKLDAKHVKFLTDTKGKPMDYSKSYNKCYARTTQQCIEGTPCWILKLPRTRKASVRKLIEAADALICEAKRASVSPFVNDALHEANLALDEAAGHLARVSK